MWREGRRADPAFRAKENAYKRALFAGSPELREKRKAYMRRYYQKNRAQMLGYGKTQEARLVKDATRYNLTVEQARGVRAMEHCAICGAPATDIDHDHKTGDIRGHLCHSCNRGLGAFKDNPSTMAAAITYLQRSPMFPRGTS